MTEGRLLDPGVVVAPWPLAELADGNAFEWESGLWTGNRPPRDAIQVLRNTNFRDDGRLDYSDVAQIEVEARHLPKKRLVSGDIILERSGGGPKQPVGRVAYFDRLDGCFSFSNFTSRLRVVDWHRFHPRFVHFFLLHFHKAGGTLTLQHNTTGIRNLHFTDYLRTRIPEPPLREQTAIVGILSAIQEARTIADRRTVLLKELKATTMAKVFREGLRGEPLKQTEIGEVPGSWDIATVGQFADVGNGSTPNRSNTAYWDEGSLPWITSTKVHEVFIQAADEFVTQQARDECHLPLVKAGSLVVAITGQGKTLGNAAMVLLDTFINQHLAFVRLKGDAICAEFLLFFLQSKYAGLRSAGQGGGTTKGALTCSFLRQYLIPVPPLSEQREIAGLLKRIHERLVTTERRRRLLEALFNGALHQLMTGQLRVTALLNTTSTAHA